MKRVSSMALAVAMSMGIVAQPLQVLAAAPAAAPQDYEIYPIPQSITYQDGQFNLNDQVNVIYENGIDEATKARVQEILALKKLNVASNEFVKGQTNILIGTADNDDKTVDNYINEKNLNDAELLKKTDSYILSSDNGTIAVLGKDNDSSFYGATTLYHVVNQLTERSIRNFLIKDYADVVSRGFIEGYYGNPWSTEDRIELMRWSGYYKLNTYFYAPKDDPKHNANWKEPYTQEELDKKIKPLAEAGNKSKCRFVYALHPYMHNAIRYNEHYTEDMDALKAKFRQVIDAGVRQIAILADDAGNPGGANYKRTLDDMTQWLTDLKAQPGYEDLKIILPFCVQEYMNGVPNLPDYYKTFPKNVQTMVTGGTIFGDVNKDFTAAFTNKFGHGPYMWVNWPCSDHSKNHLVMGGYHMLKSDVKPGTVDGIVLNPMQQSEPSKVAIFGNGCYSWNIWTDEERDQAYEDSFKYVDHNSAEETAASTALRELCKHMRNHITFGQPRHEESIELKPILEDFKAKMRSNSLTVTDVDKVIKEFEKLQKAAVTYRKEGNPTLIGTTGDYTAPEANEQMAPWLDCWDDTTAAAIAYLNGVKDVIAEKPAYVEALKQYNKGQEAYADSQSHAFFYVNHMEYAQVGRQHIVPFIEAIESYLAQTLQQFVDPSVQVSTYITNVDKLQTPDVGRIENMFDNDDATGAVFKNYLYLKQNDYIGVKYNNPITLSNIHIVMGGGKDHFHHSKLQYTTDGETWQDVNGDVYDRPEGNFAPIDVTGLNLTNVTGVRLIATADNNIDAWIEVKSFNINKKAVNKAEAYAVTADKVSVEGVVIADNNHPASKLVDGDKNTEAWLKASSNDTTPANAALKVDLGETKKVGSVYFAQGTSKAGDSIDRGVIEYSVDGSTWNELGKINSATEQTVKVEDAVDARYIRVKNLQNKGIWWRAAELTVFGPEPIVLDSAYVHTNLENHALKARLKTTGVEMTPGAVTLNKGDFIGLDLTEIRKLTSVTLPTDVKGATFQISENSVVWTDAAADNISGKTARYVRVINNTDAAIELNVDKFNVQNDVISMMGELISSDINDRGWEDARNNMKAFDGDVGTSTKFGGMPAKGNTAVYSLGRPIDIRSLRIYNTDGETDYIRDCDIQLSVDGKEWKTALTIGDDVTDTDRTTPLGSINNPEKHVDSNYPNKLYFGRDDIAPEIGNGAKYLRIVIKADYPERALVMNEIMINKGAYISRETSNSFEGTMEAPGRLPSLMLDQTLSTSYKPGQENGHITYKLDHNSTAKGVRLVQSGAVTNAEVIAEVFRNGKQETVKLGVLSDALNDFAVPEDATLLSVTVKWTNKLPAIAELIMLAEKPADKPVQPTDKPTTGPDELPPVDPSEKPGWVKVDGGWKYRDEKGNFVVNDWVHLNDIWYYCGANGMMLTGWQQLNNNWFYFDESGHMLTGWQYLNNNWFYMNESGYMLTGWQQLNGNWFYMNENGYMLTGWQQLNGNWFYFDESGYMLTGWQYLNNNWFYMNENGYMLTGWNYIDGNWFYMNESGYMLTGWQYIGGNWFYMNESGHMLTGWQQISGTWYYFYNSGAMAANTTIDGCTLNASGAWV